MEPYFLGGIVCSKHWGTHSWRDVQSAWTPHLQPAIIATNSWCTIFPRTYSIICTTKLFALLTNTKSADTVTFVSAFNNPKNNRRMLVYTTGVVKTCLMKFFFCRYFKLIDWSPITYESQTFLSKHEKFQIFYNAYSYQAIPTKWVRR